MSKPQQKLSTPLEIEKQTEKAVLVFIERTNYNLASREVLGRNEWLPKSQITIEQTEDGLKVVSATPWIINEKGLDGMRFAPRRFGF